MLVLGILQFRIVSRCWIFHQLLYLVCQQVLFVWFFLEFQFFSWVPSWSHRYEYSILSPHWCVSLTVFLSKLKIKFHHQCQYLFHFVLALLACQTLIFKCVNSMMYIFQKTAFWVVLPFSRDIFWLCQLCSFFSIYSIYDRHLTGSTNQADPSCFYFRISWILMERL